MTPCPVCGSIETWKLPVLGPPAMVSDGSALNAPLAKVTCVGCGTACHCLPPGDATLRQLFDGHGLYAHAPGGRFEATRQRHYAEWIARAVPRPPRSFGDIGCGNGSLILALQRIWPAIGAWGIEPSNAAAAQARAVGLDVRTGYPDTVGPIPAAELVIAVNVVEHTADPAAFLRSLAPCLAPDGKLLVVCPDGAKIGTELLVFDHLHSFSAHGLHRLLAAAGFCAIAAPKAPESLGDFQMAVAVPGRSSSNGCRQAGPKALHEARARFLSGWMSLQTHMLTRLEPDQRLICFGTGETANLLRTYAPRLWQHVDLCVSDDFSDPTFAGLPARPYRELAPDDARPVLLAVRDEAQPRLAARLTNEGRQVLTWKVETDAASMESARESTEPSR